MLHLLNGDSTAASFRQSMLPGEVLVWREVLSEGPADYRRQEASFWAAREHYITQAYGVAPADYHRDVTGELAALEQQLTRHEAIILWFEHDLLCQINLLYLANWFSDKNLAEGQLQVICIDRHPDHPHFRGLGELNPRQLAGLFPLRKAMTRAELTFARRAWQAYTHPDPVALAALPAACQGVWQFLPQALAIHRQRFPSRHNGLNKIETTLLQALEKGPAAPSALFGAFWRQAPLFGLGDTQILQYLAPLAEAGLVSGQEQFRLTDLGRAVLHGKQNFIDIYPLRRWLGGVLLAPGRPGWRWNPDNNQLDAA